MYNNRKASFLFFVGLFIMLFGGGNLVWAATGPYERK